MGALKKTFAIASLAFLTGGCAAADMFNMMIYHGINNAGRSKETIPHLSRDDRFYSYLVSNGRVFTAGRRSVAEHILSADGKTKKMVIYDMHERKASEIDYSNKDEHVFTTERYDHQLFINNEEKVKEVWNIIQNLNANKSKAVPYDFADICDDPHVNYLNLYWQCEMI